MTSYPVPPPNYGSAPSSPNKHTEEAREPLLGGSSRNAIFDQPMDDIPDDFKYGTTVSESAPEVRAAFVRKVYSILFVQILGTVIVGAGLRSSDSTLMWVQAHTWTLWVSFLLTLVNLGFLYWKRHSHPINLVLLSSFTLLEAFAIGIVCAFYPSGLVLKALAITTGVFLGLTLFTFQSKYDFSGMGPFLFAGLIALCFTGLISIFFPFSRGVDLAYAICGTVLFSGYVVYDTYMINKRLSPDEYILACSRLVP
ncbi:glutamate binding protein [Flagelloscypha sp. PMI_526]|nr:glutamate binding protein [Flagelloscypha sp. PMI_526]